MESNGKSVTINGEILNYSSAPVDFGEVISKAETGIFQTLH